PYNPRRSHSDASIGSHSSNESGYGGSSPNFSRQNSNSTLSINASNASVTFTNASTSKTADSPVTSSNPLDLCAPSKAGSVVDGTFKRASETDSGISAQAMEKEQRQSRESLTDSAQQMDSKRRGNQVENGSNSTLPSNGDKGQVSTNRRGLRKKGLATATEKEQEGSEQEGDQVYYAVYTFRARSPQRTYSIGQSETQDPGVQRHEREQRMVVG
ncbi:unnamed protein product, partial [Staurois parvus]